MNDVTAILNRIQSGDATATDELIPLVYEELRRLAAQKIASEKQPDCNLQATVLVHEAYLRLVGVATQRWENRAHFFAAAAEAMRRILIEQARARRRLKRGGGAGTLSLDSVGPIDTERAQQLVQLDEALDQLASSHPVKAQLVKLKFFVGLSTEDAAGVLGLSIRTAERYWAFSRAWLYREMADQSDPAD